METVAEIFRVPGDNKPISTFQLAGIPSEVVNSVASVLCRMAFEIALWSDGAIHMLVVCEEAHRYIPSDRTSASSRPARRSPASPRKAANTASRSASSPSAREARPDDPVAVLDAFCHAALQRPRPGNHPLGNPEFVDLDDQLHLLDRQRRGDRLRRGDQRADAHALFARRGEELLPKAHSATPKITEEDPDNVDLRKIVTRMRAVSGPDISAFQNSYKAASRHVRRGVTPTTSRNIRDRRLSSDHSAPMPITPPLAAVEPYRQDMLPRAYPTANPQLEPPTVRESFGVAATPRSTAAWKPAARDARRTARSAKRRRSATAADQHQPRAERVVARKHPEKAAEQSLRQGVKWRPVSGPVH
jgi:hypothetical protein